MVSAMHRKIPYSCKQEGKKAAKAKATLTVSRLISCSFAAVPSISVVSVVSASPKISRCSHLPIRTNADGPLRRKNRARAGQGGAHLHLPTGRLELCPARQPPAREPQIPGDEAHRQVRGAASSPLFFALPKIVKSCSRSSMPGRPEYTLSASQEGRAQHHRIPRDGSARHRELRPCAARRQERALTLRAPHAHTGVAPARTHTG